MDADRIRKAQDIFEVLVQTPPSDRASVLDSRCGPDHALRAFVESLISYQDQGMGGFLSEPVLPATLNLGPAEERIGGQEQTPARIGRYEIVRLIAEGGMGTVYEARQEHPKRRVALKVIRPGFATPTMMRRFQYEAEVLGRLQHPGIAQIFEAGTAVTAETPAGPVEQPFFAMEFVEGESLTDYARHHELDIRQRLNLIARVCDAVQHAHQKGVIHRDLKPANILVADDCELRNANCELNAAGGTSQSAIRNSQSAIPKILDFGIARTTDADLRTVTFGTSAGQLIGTLAYMSPEQVSGDPAQLDTRSDVYSLGVLLYELLAGRLPHDVSTCSVPEAARRIRDEEPARLTAVHRSFAGDLEILVAKALAKDKARRYQSASDLGDDLRRYLAGEPIDARRDSPLSQWYLLRKAVARHRGAAVASAAFVLLLAASTVALAFMYGNQVREKERATAAATKADAVNTFLENMLTSVDPKNTPDAEVTVRQVLDQAVRQIDAGSLKDQPELEAAMRTTLGQTYMALGRYPEAETLILSAQDQSRELHGQGSAEVANTLNDLGTLRHQQGKYSDAEPRFLEALAIRRNLFGPSHPQVADILQNLGAVYSAQRDLGKAESHLRDAIAIRRTAFAKDHPDLANSLSSLAVILNRRGLDQEAEALYREVLAMERRLWGNQDKRATDTLNNLAFLLQSRGDYAGAEPLYRESLAISRKALGNEHPELAVNLNNLAALLRDMGDLASAEPLAREGLDIRRRALPEGHANIARSALLLGLIKLEQHQAADAEPLLRECFEIRKQAMPEGHHLIAEAASALGDCLTEQGRYDEAEPLLVDSYPVIKDGRGERHERTREALQRLVRHYESRGMAQKAGESRAVLEGLDRGKEPNESAAVSSGNRGSTKP